jgi:hypothetical protein
MGKQGQFGRSRMDGYTSAQIPFDLVQVRRWIRKDGSGDIGRLALERTGTRRHAVAT